MNRRESCCISLAFTGTLFLGIKPATDELTNDTLLTGCRVMSIGIKEINHIPVEADIELDNGETYGHIMVRDEKTIAVFREYYQADKTFTLTVGKSQGS